MKQVLCIPLSTAAVMLSYLVLAGCSFDPDFPPEAYRITTITGVVETGDRSLFPKGAEIEISLLELTDESSGAFTKISISRFIVPNGEVHPFKLSFSSAQIDFNKRYWIEARLLERDKVIRISKNRPLVITLGSGLTAALDLT